MKHWFKLRKYPHFSPKLTYKHKPFILSTVTNDAKVAKHRFYPLMHYTINSGKFKRIYNREGNRSRLRESKPKTREIFYANHLDSQIYAYYSHLLGNKLECIYQKNQGLHESVLAYRRIPHNNNRNKCNIDFAKEVFDYIHKHRSDELTVLCFDVKSFFDTINHAILKIKWQELLTNDPKSHLPRDHYNIFKSVTRYSFVEISDILKAFPELKVKKHSHLKFKEIDSFCNTPIEFRRKIVEKGLIRRARDRKGVITKKGIPQGIPISATLSNLYMLEFDTKMVSLAKGLDGLYRRYSDDIIYVGKPDDKHAILSFIETNLECCLELEIQTKKTLEVRFKRNKSSSDWYYKTYQGGTEVNKQLSYLGFDYDGQQVRIRQSGLSKYYRGVKRVIRRKAFYARKAKKKVLHNPGLKRDYWIFRRGIYKSKSHLGAKKKRIDGKVYWGNFISYALNASKTFKSKAIKKQIRNHWKIIETEISQYERKYRLPKTPSRRGSKNKK